MSLIASVAVTSGAHSGCPCDASEWRHAVHAVALAMPQTRGIDFGLLSDAHAIARDKLSRRAPMGMRKLALDVRQLALQLTHQLTVTYADRWLGEGVQLTTCT
eukprot:UN0233